MTESGSDPSTTPKHLHSKETLERAVAAGSDIDLTRHHGQSNGLRVHGIYFAVVSVVVLVIVIVAVVIATSMM